MQKDKEEPQEEKIPRLSLFPTFRKYPFPFLIALIVLVGLTTIFVTWSIIAVPTPLVEVRRINLFPLTLVSPTEGTYSLNNEILVKGKTLPQTAVIVYTDSDQTSVTSDDQGNFETTISLSSGINTLNVTAFGADGAEKNLSINIVRDSKT